MSLITIPRAGWLAPLASLFRARTLAPAIAAPALPASELRDGEHAHIRSLRAAAPLYVDEFRCIGRLAGARPEYLIVHHRL